MSLYDCGTEAQRFTVSGLSKTGDISPDLQDGPGKGKTNTDGNSKTYH